ncbi:helix-turn-helix transcriptional regulator [Stenotrophomonas sp. Iso1]|uniref:helix-turn-helix transcriptional regulator n=1 Tax=Stenotrophomonas sp. Iso1 TaxID=2977283 RepID=UPI0022B7B0E7|nr:helix-turn-helix transcriptional regulator [Stenotrophomonas sp. Iso1]
MLGREHDIAVNPDACPVQAKVDMIRALDMHALWRACVDLINQRLPCHSCTLMYDITGGYQPQRSLHFLGETPCGGAWPLRSLDVAAPYLQQNPRIHWYTLSQIASGDAQARQRLRAQNPARGWREFIHMAFWGDDGLEAVLSIRMHEGHEQITDTHQQFLGELHQLMGAGLQRVRSLQAERRTVYQALLDRQSLPDIILDHDLHPISVSPAAQRLCADWLSSHDSHAGFPDAIASALRDWLDPADKRDIGSGLQVCHPRQSKVELHITLEGRLLAHPQQPLYLLRLAPMQSATVPTATDARPLWSKLSPTEQRVAGLVVEGMRNDEIAHHLSRSRKTIESQISAIYRKLDVGHRAQLVRLLSTV